jgi:hypothetical protein
MARPHKFTKEQVIDALKKAHGLKTGAAELLGCSFPAIDKYCQRYPDAQAVVDHWRKRRKDRAEYKLDEAIERGEPWALMFTLKNARDREYSERLSIVSETEINDAIERELARLVAGRQAEIPPAATDHADD